MHTKYDKLVLLTVTIMIKIHSNSINAEKLSKILEGSNLKLILNSMEINTTI